MARPPLRIALLCVSPKSVDKRPCGALSMRPCKASAMHVSKSIIGIEWSPSPGELAKSWPLQPVQPVADGPHGLCRCLSCSHTIMWRMTTRCSGGPTSTKFFWVQPTASRANKALMSGGRTHILRHHCCDMQMLPIYHIALCASRQLTILQLCCTVRQAGCALCLASPWSW